MKIRMAKPLFFIRGHLLENVDPYKEHAAHPAGAGYLKIIDSTGKTVFLSKTMQKRYFEVTEKTD